MAKLYESLSEDERSAILTWSKTNNLDCVMVRTYSNSIRFEECGDSDDACIEFKHNGAEDNLSEFDNTAFSISEVVFGTKSWENRNVAQ